MLEYLLSALNDAVLAYDMDDKRFLFISPAVYDILGYNADDFSMDHKLLFNAIYPEDKLLVLAQVANIEVPAEVKLNYRILTPTGEIKHVQEKRVYLKHSKSNHNICIHVIRDVTEAVLYKMNAEHKMWFLSTLINAVGVLIFRTGTDGKYSYVNDIYTRLLGYPIDELIGHNLSSVTHPDDVERITEVIHSCALNPGKVYHIKHRKITNTGAVRWILTDATAVKDDFGRVTEIQGVGMDITDQEMIQEEMSWTKNNLEALINNTNDLIWSIDTDRKYVFANTSLKMWVEARYNADLAEGKPTLNKEYSQTMVDTWRTYYDRALAGETFTANYTDTSPITNATSTLEVAFNPIRNADQRIVGVGCFAHDITESLKHQEEIIDQNERLKNIASLSSHELRRPVATLIGLISLIDKDDPANPENRQIHEHMATVSKELDDVIRLIVEKTFI